MPKVPINRRVFLAHSAAGAAAFAAPLVVSAASLGLAGKPAASERVSVGLIGAGRQSRFHNIRQFLAMPDVTLCAVCDVDAWRLTNAKAQVESGYASQSPSGAYGGCAATGDFRELLVRNDIDAVMIAAPDHLHASMAVAAMAAGKDVSLEKPIARTIAEGRQLSDAAAALQRVFRVDSELRSNRNLHLAATLVRNGLIGQVRRITVGVPAGDRGYRFEGAVAASAPVELDYKRWLGSAPDVPYCENRVHPPRAYARPGWMRHLHYCDGMIANWGSHFADAALWAADLERTGPVEIEGTGHYPPEASLWNVLLDFHCHYRFAGGVELTLQTDAPHIRLQGDEGWVYADVNKIEAAPASLLSWKPSAGATTFRLKSEKRDFIDCVKTREETLEPAEVGHRVTSLCLLGHIAVRLGQRLQWNPREERFVGNSMANALLGRPISSPLA